MSTATHTSHVPHSPPSLADLAPRLLQKERHGASFRVQSCIDLVVGGPDVQARQRQLLALVASHPILGDRNMLFRNHTQRYEMGLQKSYAYAELLRDHNITLYAERAYVYMLIGEFLPISVHLQMFIPTLEMQMDDEQKATWLPKVYSYEITGAYAQTELGHGSNVQGIETTAQYDPTTQEFILHSPTLTSRKWWPGGLGKTANHCVLHARLILDGQDRGVQAFLVPIRDPKTHKTLSGITLGDIGPKIGFNAIDNGYCVLNQVRIPRRNMLMRFAKVAPDGSFSNPPMDKLVYFTMVKVRVYLLEVVFQSLGKTVAIGTRFSAARVQGRKRGASSELQVLDYENQQLALFPLIGMTYASLFTHRAMDTFYNQVLAQLDGEMDLEQMCLLGQLHASASGLKALLTEEAANGMERVRRACGGHGYSASSNLPHIFQEFVGACTYEGTKDVLVQQHVSFLLKCLRHPMPVTRVGALDLLGFLQVDPTGHCQATEPTHLCEPQVLLQAFQVRALKLLQRAAKVKSMHHLTQASLAHAESIVLSCFYQGVMAVSDLKLQAVLLQLWQLYGLWRIQANLGEFRLDDYLSSSQGAWAQDQLLELLQIVRPNAVALVDGFGFSDFELNSAIGRYDGDIYRALIERATHEPLNATDVTPGYHKWLQPLLTAKL
ncbi:Aste57867_17852 [Aphanomyces stellatus]|uniref:Acyl-coenzyme A oxidase n=1 Tax=Aphanomyces stellatus TaxID=120398 RepID=A0A485L8P4_9STRA|nr:hypothetical protein As57867_017791 [Aphanomyces stellatus]VFT94595.1 Aste57867_17852 [Aphanomyces stellatus]